MATIPARTLLELTRRYSEPHRHYHTLEHVAWMLHLGRELDLDDGQVPAAGLRAFLKGFLESERIYWTPWGGPREPAASANLERLLAEVE